MVQTYGHASRAGIGGAGLDVPVDPPPVLHRLVAARWTAHIERQAPIGNASSSVPTPTTTPAGPATAIASVRCEAAADRHFGSVRSPAGLQYDIYDNSSARRTYMDAFLDDVFVGSFSGYRFAVQAIEDGELDKLMQELADSSAHVGAAAPVPVPPAPSVVEDLAPAAPVPCEAPDCTALVTAEYVARTGQRMHGSCRDRLIRAASSTARTHAPAGRAGRLVGAGQAGRS